MIDREFFNREAVIDHHEEKVHRLARHIGGYIYRYLSFFDPLEIPYVLPAHDFPTEIMAVVDTAKNGALDRRVRRTPHLSFIFDLLQGEEPMINWEILSLTPEIALYATGNLTYAESVKNYMQQAGAQIG